MTKNKWMEGGSEGGSKRLKWRDGSGGKSKEGTVFDRWSGKLKVSERMTESK